MSVAPLHRLPVLFEGPGVEFNLIDFNRIATQHHDVLQLLWPEVCNTYVTCHALALEVLECPPHILPAALVCPATGVLLFRRRGWLGSHDEVQVVYTVVPQHPVHLRKRRVIAVVLASKPGLEKYLPARHAQLGGLDQCLPDGCLVVVVGRVVQETASGQQVLQHRPAGALAAEAQTRHGQLASAGQRNTGHSRGRLKGRQRGFAAGPGQPDS
mmetsp:Transcript_105055/g.338762  ORF Transcript_105055/g.338762 Transcript_105055/m.338762 type:complete len:213 (-) Transcript_105055:160-798(-)